MNRYLRPDWLTDFAHGTFTNAHLEGAYITFCIIILICHYFYGKKIFNNDTKKRQLLLLFLFFGVLVVTETKHIWILMPIIMISVFLMLRVKNKTNIMIGMIITFLLFVFGLKTFWPSPYNYLIGYKNKNFSEIGKIQGLYTISNTINSSNNPVLGVGPSMFITGDADKRRVQLFEKIFYKSKYVKSKFYTSEYGMLSDLLGIWVEIGYLGIITFLLLYFKTFRIIKMKKTNKYNLEYTIVIVSLIYLFSADFMHRYISVSIAVYTCWMTIAYYIDKVLVSKNLKYDKTIQEEI
ncbi:hypothetical protein ISS37_00135 [candidate division KSB1 bacterium]|nr:hypothetical protein [candidate division KSB1 bacterium]